MSSEKEYGIFQYWKLIRTSSFSRTIIIQQRMEPSIGPSSIDPEPTNLQRGEAYVSQRQRAQRENNFNIRKGEAFISIIMFSEAKEFKSLCWWMDSGASDHMSYKRMICRI